MSNNAHYIKELPPILGLDAQVCNMKQCVYLMVKVWTKSPKSVVLY